MSAEWTQFANHGLAPDPSQRVTWQIFLDLQCPYSKVAAEKIPELRAAFGTRMLISTHFTSLSFHPQAFLAQCAAKTFETTTDDETYQKFIAAMWENQANYMNGATAEMCKDEIKAEIANIAEAAELFTAEFTRAQFLRKLDDWELTTKPAYADVKFALNLQAYGTPKHVIHGRVVANTESKWGAEEWTTKLQELEAANWGIISDREQKEDKTERVPWKIFIDLQCPYSKRVWDNLSKLRAAFDREYHITVHLVPLHFHPQAFTAQCAAKCVQNVMDHSDYWAFVGHLFMHQERYMNTATKDMTRDQIVDVFYELLQGCHPGIMDAKEFKAEIAKWNETTMPAYTDAKFAWDHKAFGTPSHVIYGRKIEDTESAWEPPQWAAKLRQEFPAKREYSEQGYPGL
jgi:protein-disulfide isomerase